MPKQFLTNCRKVIPAESSSSNDTKTIGIIRWHSDGDGVLWGVTCDTKGGICDTLGVVTGGVGGVTSMTIGTTHATVTLSSTSHFSSPDLSQSSSHSSSQLNPISKSVFYYDNRKKLPHFSCKIISVNTENGLTFLLKPFIWSKAENLIISEKLICIRVKLIYVKVPLKKKLWHLVISVKLGLSYS